MDENETALVAPTGSTVAHTMKSASFMMIFSFLLLIEGSSRASRGISALIAMNTGTNVLKVISAIAEITMALYGGAVSIGYMGGHRVQKRSVLGLLIWVHLAGYFVFITYTMVLPGLTLATEPTYIVGATSVNQFYGVCAIFTGMSLCFALQGGHISFVFALYFDEQTYDDHFYKSRSNLYLFNLFLVGLWWTIGASLAHSAGIDASIKFPPFFLQVDHTVTPLIAAVIILCTSLVGLYVNNADLTRAKLGIGLLALGLSTVFSIVIMDHYSAGIAGAVPAGGPLMSVLLAAHLVPSINLGMRYSLLGAEFAQPLSIINNKN